MTKKDFQKALNSLSQTAIKIFDKRQVTGLARIYQIAWFRKVPNDAILKEFEQFCNSTTISKKSFVIASAMNKTQLQPQVTSNV